MSPCPDSFLVPLSKDHIISPSATPLKTPSLLSPHIIVIGGGVTGLVTSWVLLDRGYRVTILSKTWANYSANGRLTSQIAGALWEYPPAVCGSHTDKVSLRRSKEWAMVSYHGWRRLAESDFGPTMGVNMIRSAFFFPKKVEDDQKQLTKMQEIERAGVHGFSHNAALISEMNVNAAVEVVDAYELLAPVIDTDKAVHWLMSLLNAKGAHFVTEELNADLLSLEESLLARFNAKAVVNCTGLASHLLASDTMCYPLRGALLRYVNDGSSFPKIRHALAISADANTEGKIVFIVPRNDNILVVGGFAEPDKWVLDHTTSSPLVRRMQDRAMTFLPALKHAQLDSDYPIAQGLRPARRGNVRLERETRNQDSKIVHSYGHGGSGWSLSFGCAIEAANIVEKIVTGFAENQDATLCHSEIVL